MTMADLAVDRETERAGWEAIRGKAEEERVVVGDGQRLRRALTEELLPLFARSIEPIRTGVSRYGRRATRPTPTAQGRRSPC